jgi:hypothetical protein
LRVTARLHETRAAEGTQVVRDQVLRPPEHLLELAHAPFSPAEQSDQLEPSRVAKQP